MRDKIGSYLSSVSAGGDQRAMAQVFRGMARALNSGAVASAGLVIFGAASALAKTGATPYYAFVNGSYVTIAAGTTMPALTGLTIAANRFNYAAFFIDRNSTVAVRFGTEGGTAGGAIPPDFPNDGAYALVGMLLITNTATFTGGTTALDAPATTVFLSPVGAFDPTYIF
ncbi:MAG: hypothetical protein RL030_1784 [Pseudomonadota bacterium]|jgi:hypothetical protein